MEVKEKNIEEMFEEFNQLTESIESKLESKRKSIEKKRHEVEDSEMFGKYNEEYVKKFFKKPYVIIPKKENEWYLIVPKMFDISVGYLFKSDDSFNVFIVNKYADYLGNVPTEFKEVFKFKQKLPLKVFDGMMLTGEENQEEAWSRYSRFLIAREGKDRIRIKKGDEFNLIAQLINDGILPFMPKPVEKEHIIESMWRNKIPEIEKRREMKFFKEAFKKFLDTGAIGLYWAMGVGKTIFGLEALSKIRVETKPNLVVAGSSIVLREQWLEKLRDIVQASNTEVYNYQSYEKIRNTEWGLVIFDECHHLPANIFSRLATIRADYRIGLSATPYREDGRTDYIFALTGYPVGLDWKILIELGLIKMPKVTLMLCTDYVAKKRKIQEMLMDPVKTLIYSFGIDEGEKLSKFLEIPFVHGQTPVQERLTIIKSSIATIISSAGKEGLSLPNIKRTITYNFLFGSRQEETQFFGRVLHGQEEGEHYILMTDEEYETYGKRLYGIEEKGFKIRMVRI